MKIESTLLNVSKKDGEIKFRPLVAADLPFLIEVRNECRNFLHDNREFSLSDANEWFNKTQPDFWLILKDDERIGYFRTSRYQSNTKTIVVGADLHFKFRGLGLGRICWNLFLEKLKKAGFYRVRLEVLENNKRAFKLYNSLGFYELRYETKFITRDNQKLRSIVMEMELCPQE